MPLDMCLPKIWAHRRLLQNYQNLIEMTSNMIYIVAFGGGLKCPRKIHLKTSAPQFLADQLTLSQPIYIIFLLFCTLHDNFINN